MGKIEVFADLHIHSRYSRACSKNINIENLEKYGKIKGLGLLGTGDFQHAEWRKEIDEKLEEDDKGILRSKNGMSFIWQTEISLMFTQDGKGRAVHLVILVPCRRVADEVTKYLGSKGRLDYDGRPIFGISCSEVVRDLKAIDDKIEIIPAHCMTPWFGIFGSVKGFDSLKECFGEQVDKIYAVESGMSADPEMLWRLGEKFNIVSFSDSHSYWPWRLGREATLFEFNELSYDNVIKAIRTGNGLKGTIETPPAYGKYHWDGHRICEFSCGVEETKKLNGKCPKCGKDLIIGVDNRIDKLAVRGVGEKVEGAKMYYELLPLHEVIALHLGSGLFTRKSWETYDNLIKKFENEFNVLLKVSREEMIRKQIDEKLVELIMLNRENGIKVKPGYDGVYGEAILGEKQGKLV